MKDTLELTQQTPPEWCEKLLSRWGQNPHRENIYRIVWGAQRVAPIGTGPGKVEQLPKYLLECDGQLNRWILEKWLSPKQIGSPERWYEETWSDEHQVHMLGPYPVNGEYELCHILQTEIGTFLPLEYGFLELLVTLIEKGKDTNFAERKRAILERHRQADETARKHNRDLIDEAFREVRMHLAMNPSKIDRMPIKYALERPVPGMQQLAANGINGMKLRKL